MNPILVPVSPGELIDKITILQIKSERMTDPAKLRNVRAELRALTAVRDEELPVVEPLDRLTTELAAINGKLWTVEESLRQLERRQDFGSRFVALARSVYYHNDMRAAAKAAINMLLGSPIVEEKEYA